MILAAVLLLRARYPPPGLFEMLPFFDISCSSNSGSVAYLRRIEERRFVSASLFFLLASFRRWAHGPARLLVPASEPCRKVPRGSGERSRGDERPRQHALNFFPLPQGQGAFRPMPGLMGILPA